MKNWMKTKYIIGTIVIAIIANALWENIFRNLFAFSGKALLTISTLGIERYKDNIYSDIAKGFYESVSLLVLNLFLGVLAGLISGVLFALYWRVKNSGEKERDQRSPGWLFSDKRRIRWVLLVYLIFLISFSILSLSRATYTNKAVAYYGQLSRITAPYLTEEQEEEFDSQFAQIKNKSDYVNVIEGLKKIAKDHGQALPTPPSFIF